MEKHTQTNNAQTKGKQKKPKVKRVRQFGVFSYLFLLFFILFIFTATPLYSFILAFLPETYKQALVGGFYRNITLAEDKELLSEPFKYDLPETLPVYGYNSGICFSFYSTRQNENTDFIDAKRLAKAEKGKKIAEIIVIGNNKYEYSLKQTTMNETVDDNGKDVSSICQIFGNDYPIIPDMINEVYVRPLKPFTPYKVIWATTRNIYLE